MLSAGHRSRGHSLYYGDLGEGGRYGWFELGFMRMSLSHEIQPIPLSAREGLAALDHQTFVGVQLGWGMASPDPGDPGDFVQRWAEWFGLAAAGRLPALNRLPDGPTHYPPNR